jgi:hypothetical protein
MNTTRKTTTLSHYFKYLLSNWTKWNGQIKCRMQSKVKKTPPVFCRGIEESALFPSPRWTTRARVSFPLVPARTKCSLWDDPLPLRRSGSLMTAYKLEPGHQQILWGDHRAAIATKPSRWYWSPRVISHRLSLNQEKPNACGVCYRWLSLALIRS